jgi:Thiamine pyrophosphate enzyme, N-terminal TPP binding domain
MPKLYEALAEAFLAEGVDTQFVLMGDGNMHWSTAFAKLPGVHTVHVRHEHCTVAAASRPHMARGRSTGHPPRRPVFWAAPVAAGGEARRRKVNPTQSRRKTPCGAPTERDVMELFGGYRPDQSSFAPENFTTFAHFSVSSAMNLPKSAGELANAVEPKSAMRAFIFGSASTKETRRNN